MGNKPELPVTRTCIIGQAAQDMVRNARFTATGNRRLPDCLHDGHHRGKGNPPHAYWLPEDVNEDGMIDHILVFAYGGLSPAAIRSLSLCHCFTLSDGQKSGQTFDLMPEWMGWQPEGVYYGHSHIWQSRTPWFPSPNVHRLDPEAEIRRELARRGKPIPLAVKILDSSDIIPNYPHAITDFTLKRQNPGAQKQPIPKAETGCYLKIYFEDSVKAPLGLGYGSHFGLGAFGAVG